MVKLPPPNTVGAIANLLFFVATVVFAVHTIAVAIVFMVRTGIVYRKRKRIIAQWRSDIHDWEKTMIAVHWFNSKFPDWDARHLPYPKIPREPAMPEFPKPPNWLDRIRCHFDNM